MVLTDKDMADDMLAGLEQMATAMLRACYHTSDAVLRQLLIQWVDQNEKRHSALLQLATKKGWSLPAPPTDAAALDYVRQFFVEPINAVPPN
jgi:spore coat protein CotF